MLSKADTIAAMSGQVLQKLGAIAEAHWGMFTTAQAASSGIDRARLSRLSATGAITRELQGVYRMAGAPLGEHALTYATWLALGGDRAEVPSVVAAGETAATLHGMGDFYPAGWDFIVPTRRSTRLPGVRLRVRTLTPAEVTYLDGMPVLTVERTIADLIGQWTDLSLVADAVRDAVRLGTLVHPQLLVDYLNPHAKGAGYVDGHAFASALFELAGAEPIGSYR